MKKAKGTDDLHLNTERKKKCGQYDDNITICPSHTSLTRSTYQQSGVRIPTDEKYMLLANCAHVSLARIFIHATVDCPLLSPCSVPKTEREFFRGRANIMQFNAHKSDDMLPTTRTRRNKVWPIKKPELEPEPEPGSEKERYLICQIPVYSLTTQNVNPQPVYSPAFC